jgi:hypothetical protein
MDEDRVGTAFGLCPPYEWVRHLAVASGGSAR